MLAPNLRQILHNQQLYLPQIQGVMGTVDDKALVHDFSLYFPYGNKLIKAEIQTGFVHDQRSGPQIFSDDDDNRSNAGSLIHDAGYTAQPLGWTRYDFDNWYYIVNRMYQYPFWLNAGGYMVLRGFGWKEYDRKTVAQIERARSFVRIDVFE